MSENTFRDMNQRYCFEKMSYFGEMYKKYKNKIYSRMCITIIVFWGFLCGQKKEDFKFYSNLRLFLPRDRPHNKTKTIDYFAQRSKTTAGLPFPLHLHNITFIVAKHCPTREML